jgi:ATP-dependent RNA helicase DeaD
LRDHRAQVCVATDVAARGIDLPDLELVVHADLPKNTEALLHRSGRTGRAGRKGASVLIVPYSARRRTERLLRDANINAQWGEPPSADDIRRRDDERLLADPLFQTQPEAAEQAVVSALVARHDPAHIAAAFVRLYRKGQAAPEDLAPTQVWSPNLDRPERAPRAERGERVDRGPPINAPDNFTPGAWVSLSVGRGRNAEPKWLIPMLCKAGGITKRQLGSIRIDQDETFVEIDAAIVDEFITRIGKGGHIEKSIHVKRVEGAPAARERRPPRKPEGAAYGDRPSKKPEGSSYGDRAPRRPEGASYGDRAPRKPEGSSYGDRAPRKPEGKPYGDRAPPRAEKKPHRGQAAKPTGKGDRKHPGAAKHADIKHPGATKPKKKNKWRPD